MEFALRFGGVCLENLLKVSDESLAKWVGGQEGRPHGQAHTPLPSNNLSWVVGKTTLRHG